MRRTTLVEERQVEIAKALGVGDGVDLDDLPARAMVNVATRHGPRRSTYNLYVQRTDRSAYPTTLTTLAAGEQQDALSRLTPGERVEMVWQLTREAWTFKDGRWDEPRLRRDVGRVIRRRG